MLVPLVRPAEVLTASGTDMPSGPTHYKQNVSKLPHMPEVFFVIHVFLVPL
jgi:hypothetical protein